MLKSDYLLICLIEECAEIQKAATKVIRYGFQGKKDGSNLTNVEQLILELNDLQTVVEFLEKYGLIEKDDTSFNRQPKRTAKKKILNDELTRLDEGVENV